MNNLIVILGPTGVGKTELSLKVAEHFKTGIISADSRQIFREMPICTAAATPQQMARVKHYFVGTKSICETYSAAQFEADALQLIGDRDFVMCGGSMMYIDAVCKGIDDMPQADPAIRQTLRLRLERDGLQSLLDELSRLDPEYFASVDKCNPQRVLHGLEMCLTTGRPFSSFRTGQSKARPFNIIKIGITRTREELYRRIDARVDEMFAQGLEHEARKVYERYRASVSLQLKDVVRNPGPTQAQPIPNLLPAVLNTVGLKEMLLYFEGIYSLDRAKERICHNSHIYAKKQMTWFQRDQEIQWFSPDDLNGILLLLHSKIDVI